MYFVLHYWNEQLLDYDTYQYIHYFYGRYDIDNTFILYCIVARCGGRKLPFQDLLAVSRFTTCVSKWPCIPDNIAAICISIAIRMR
jgi:hypothetical protein